MSLDITLCGPSMTNDCCHCDGTGKIIENKVHFETNITHNMGLMAEEAGIYKVLWDPHSIDATRAIELVQPLQDGLAILKSDPERFKKFNPENGWGSYDSFVPWVEEYLKACIDNPCAFIEVSR